MKPWKIALPMYMACAPAAHLLLMKDIIAGLRAAGWMEPVEIDEETDDLESLWHCPDLLLAQACGYPLMTRLAGQVRLLGTACHDFPGCDAHQYASFIVVRENAEVQSLEDLRGLTAAFNQPHSQSGMNALRHAVAPLARLSRFFGRVVESGSHLASLRLLQRGQADVAAVDCITYGYTALHAPQTLDGLRILSQTASTPALPLIASTWVDDTLAALLRRVLRKSLAPGVANSPAAMLNMTGFAATELSQYRVILEAQQLAKDCGYPELA